MIRIGPFGFESIREFNRMFLASTRKEVAAPFLKKEKAFSVKNKFKNSQSVKKGNKRDYRKHF